MIILTLRSDKPQAEVGLFDDDKELAYIKWQAHRELSTTLHSRIDEVLNKSSKFMQDIQGIVIYKGPGSFTGLRIGFSVANALAYAGGIPIIAIGGDDWLAEGVKKLLNGAHDKIATPEYGAEPHITLPRK